MTEARRGWLGVELDPAWYDAMSARVSRRRFDGRPVAQLEWNRLRDLAGELAASGVRITLLDRDGEEVFIGLPGGYGKPAGAPCAALFSASEGADLEVGYAGEAFVLAATALGLGTCWVAGNFRRRVAARKASLRDGERVFAATPVGYPVSRPDAGERAVRGVSRAHTRLHAREIAPGFEGWPEWARSAVEAARIAPSGGNKQPWRFSLDNDQLILAEIPARFYWTHRMDCGIAMLHAELGARHVGCSGVWRITEAEACPTSNSQPKGSRNGSEVSRFIMR